MIKNEQIRLGLCRKTFSIGSSRVLPTRAAVQPFAADAADKVVCHIEDVAPEVKRKGDQCAEVQGDVKG